MIKKTVQTPIFDWLIHINELPFEVKSSNVEGALMLAFAQYYEKNPEPNLLVFDISVLNVTLYQAQFGIDNILDAAKAKKSQSTVGVPQR